MSSIWTLIMVLAASFCPVSLVAHDCSLDNVPYRQVRIGDDYLDGLKCVLQGAGVEYRIESSAERAIATMADRRIKGIGTSHFPECLWDMLLSGPAQPHRLAYSIDASGCYVIQAEAPSGTSKELLSRKVTLDVENVWIEDAIRGLFLQTGSRYVCTLTKSQLRFVSLTLRDVPLISALEQLLDKDKQGPGVRCRAEVGVVCVGPKGKKAGPGVDELILEVDLDNVELAAALKALFHSVNLTYSADELVADHVWFRSGHLTFDKALKFTLRSIPTPVDFSKTKDAYRIYVKPAKN